MRLRIETRAGVSSAGGAHPPPSCCGRLGRRRAVGRRASPTGGWGCASAARSRHPRAGRPPQAPGRSALASSNAPRDVVHLARRHAGRGQHRHPLGGRAHAQELLKHLAQACAIGHARGVLGERLLVGEPGRPSTSASARNCRSLPTATTRSSVRRAQQLRTARCWDARCPCERPRAPASVNAEPWLTSAASRLESRSTSTRCPSPVRSRCRRRRARRPPRTGRRSRRRAPRPPSAARRRARR